MQHLKKYDEYNDLLKDLQDLDLAFTKEEMDMYDFIKEFGGNKEPEDFADYLKDYYKNPSDYDIDTDSDYYLAIGDYYLDIEEFNKNRNPFYAGTDVWKIKELEKSDTYQTYSKMSKIVLK